MIFSRISALVTVLAVIFSGIAGAQEAKLNIVATIKPVHSLVAKVMGATGTPALLVDGNALPPYLCDEAVRRQSSGRCSTDLPYVRPR